jgi:hypothetical protein
MKLPTRGDFVSFWNSLGDAIGKGLEVVGTALAHQKAVEELMEMSEASGMVHLSVLVPAVVEDDWMDEFMGRLRTCERDESESSEYRQKAKTFRIHAGYLADRHG